MLDERPDLSNAVDFAIDESGYIFVLMNDGSMLRFLSGESQFFQFSQLPGGGVGSLGSASSLYLDLGLRSIGFYVIDGAKSAPLGVRFAAPTVVNSGAADAPALPESQVEPQRFPDGRIPPPMPRLRAATIEL